MDTQKIQVIRQAEEQAKKIISAAEELANNNIRDAHAQADTIETEAKKLAREQENSLLSEYQHKGESKAHTIISELSRELTNINNSATSKETDAVAYLKEQMKVAYGN